MEEENGAQNEISVFSPPLMQRVPPRTDRVTLILLSLFLEISRSWFASSTNNRAFNANFMPDSFLLGGGNSKGGRKIVSSLFVTLFVQSNLR